MKKLVFSLIFLFSILNFTNAQIIREETAEIQISVEFDGTQKVIEREINLPFACDYLFSPFFSVSGSVSGKKAFLKISEQIYWEFLPAVEPSLPITKDSGLVVHAIRSDPKKPGTVYILLFPFFKNGYKP